MPGFGAPYHAHGTLPASSGAQSAADAAFSIHLRDQTASRRALVEQGTYRYGSDRTRFGATTATGAGVGHRSRLETAGDHRREIEAPDGRELSAAATTAAAQIGGPIAHVIHDVHQPELPGTSDQFESFDPVHGSTEIVPDHVVGASVERKADVRRTFAGVTQVLSLMPAVAEGDGQSLRIPDDARGLLPVEHLGQVGFRDDASRAPPRGRPRWRC